ncbi:MAG: hypothetical protein JO310_17725 [Hyphomicrobiales bacterium]|nr:hypothetical protein [Hyphomicrobiales bacterium]
MSRPERFGRTVQLRGEFLELLEALLLTSAFGVLMTPAVTKNMVFLARDRRYACRAALWNMRVLSAQAA